MANPSIHSEPVEQISTLDGIAGMQQVTPHGWASLAACSLVQNVMVMPELYLDHPDNSPE